jgi:hypothetical protein
MNRREFLYLTGGFTALTLCPANGAAFGLQAERRTIQTRMLGMYVHEGWPYNHPYAARTWTVEDWRGYADGLSRLGYNTISIWPALETMPDPLLPSDRAQIENTAAVVDLLHREFDFRVYVTICPNVVPYPTVAKKYAFEDRPLFAGTTLEDPSDPVAIKRMMDRREKLLRPLERMDGLVIIDSDPGAYPGSTNAQFVNVLHEYRKLLDRLRPGIEVVYWMHMGWAAFSRYEATGQFRWGDPAEAEDVLRRLKELNDMKPFRITIHTLDPPPNGTDLKLAENMGLASNALTFNYGAIEAEPSFPITNFGGDGAFKAGQLSAPGGVVGNAQTHCIQLPNTLAFARGAEGKALPTEADYVEFANDLIMGQGQLIVQSWRALAGADPVTMREMAGKLEALDRRKLTPGPLKGLLFGDPSRFITDIVMELRLRAAFEDFVMTSEKNQDIKGPFLAFVTAADAYQRRTGYPCLWDWPRLDESLRRLKSPAIGAILDEKDFVKEIPANEGTPFRAGGPYHNRYSDGLMKAETSTPRLIEAMKEALKRL